MLHRSFVAGLGLCVGLSLGAGSAAAELPTSATPYASEEAQGVVLEARAERLDFYLNRSVLASYGFEVRNERGTAPTSGANDLAFSALPVAASLNAKVTGFGFLGLAGGETAFQGGFDLSWSGGSLSLADFRVVPGTGKDLFWILDRAGVPVFALDNPHSMFDPDQRRLTFRHMDLRFTSQLAQRAGRPELADVAIAEVTLDTRVFSLSSWEPLPDGACSPTFTGDVDVVLSTISQLNLAASDTTRVAIAPSASLFNGGTADVYWYRAITPDGSGAPIGQHPYLVLHVYRELDGVFEQISQGDVKHAFFAVNSGCVCSGGQVLFVGCSDTYGTSNNINRFYLAPRGELTAGTGTWSSLSSHFDATPTDDFRHHGDTSGTHGPFDHRLVIDKANLDLPGARYFIEAWYIVQGDINIFNSIGWREFDPTLTNGTWTFPFVDNARVSGAAIDAWVSPASASSSEHNEIVTTSQGHVQLAVKTTTLPDGWIRYDYALMNLDEDRQIRSFEVPVLDSASVRNVGFRDRDTDGANDWSASRSGGVQRWTTSVGQPSLNALDWGTLYGFSFEAQGAVSQTENASLGMLEPELGGVLAAATLAPNGSADIFIDGFESGGLSAWTATIP